MLGAIRSKKNNPVIVLLLGFVVVLMAGFGVTLSGGSGGTYAADVGGEEISYTDYARSYARAFSSRQQQDRTYDRARSESEDLRGRVMDEMIAQKLLAQEARRRGLAIDDEALRNAIWDIPSFQDESGTFDPELYERALMSNGTHPVAFEAEMREQLLSDLLMGILRGEGPSEAELRTRLEAESTKVAVRVLKVPTSGFEARVGDITEADVEAWASGVEDPDADVLARYQRDKATKYDVPKQVCARHILQKFDEKAPEDIKARARAKLAEAGEKIASGELSFADAAKAYSQDGSASKGGDLGCFGPGQMVPAFEEAAFGLEPGQRSNAVNSMFGVHLIEVYDVKAPIRTKLESVKDDIRKELAGEAKAKQLAKAEAAQLLEVAQTTKSLEAALAAVQPEPEVAPVASSTVATSSTAAAPEPAPEPEAPTEPELPKMRVEETAPFTRTQRFVPKLGLAGPATRAAWTLTEEAPLVSAPVEMPDGWALLELASKTEPSEDELEGARKSTLYTLISEKQGALYERLLEELRAEAKVEVNPIALSYDDALRQRIFQRQQ